MLADADSIHTYRWAISLSEFCEVLLFSFRKPINYEYSKTRIKLFHINGHEGNKLYYFLSLKPIKKIIKRYSPDIVHAHYASSYGLMAAIVNHPKMITSFWGTDIYEFPHKSFLHKGVIKFILKRSSVVLSTSHIMAREIKKYTDKEIEITPFGIDGKKFFKIITEEKNNIINIGITKSLNVVYGIDILLHAFKLVLDKWPYKNLRLKILGEGPEKNNLKKLADQLKISDNVDFVGWVNNAELVYYYNSFYLSVFPSLMESFGVAALESMACGTPVITSNADGYKEIVNEKVGVIVPIRNFERLSEEIIKLLWNPEKREKMSIECVNYVNEHFDFSKNVQQMLEIYKKELGGF